MNDIECRLRRLEEISARGTSGVKFIVPAGSEPPRCLPTDSACKCAGRPAYHVRAADHFYICDQCGGLVPAVIGSLEASAGSPAELE
jgi:hypothetical protein